MNTRPAQTLAVTVATLLLGSSLAYAQLRLWTTEEQSDRLALQEQMATEFEAATGIAVAVVPVPEGELGQRATAAFAAGDLPDVIYHSLPYVPPWSETGILDVEANNRVVTQLGRETFAPGSLAMADFDGRTAAVPVDGWTQMVIYRKDLFEGARLKPPNTYADIVAAINKLHNPPETYGFVAPTRVGETFTSQVLEHVFLANGASPIREDGSTGFDEKKTIEVLEFYKKLVDASPPGEHFREQSRELYFAGRAAMIFGSPFILDELAGLQDSNPPKIDSDPTSSELAAMTSIVTRLSGPSNPDGAAWGDVHYFGITSSADTEAAAEFVKFALDDDYTRTLSIAPEGKIPARRGTPQAPDKFVEAWQVLPIGVDRKAALSDLYPPETIANIVGGLEVADRWGLKESQFALASKIIDSRAINRAIRQYIDGERNAAETVTLINEQIAEID